MDELFFDYHHFGKVSTRRKQLFRGFGVLCTGVGIYLVIAELNNEGSFSLLISGILNLLLGILFFAQSFDIKLLYPKKFIRVNDELFAFNLWTFRKPVKIPWNSVIAIHKKISHVIFLLDDTQQIRFKTKYLPSSDVKRVLSRIENIARQKKIELVSD